DVAVPDCGDGAIFRAVAAHGALLLLSADFVLGVSLRTQARDSHRLRLRFPDWPSGLPQQHDARTPGSFVAWGTALQLCNLGRSLSGYRLRDGYAVRAQAGDDYRHPGKFQRTAAGPATLHGHREVRHG